MRHMSQKSPQKIFSVQELVALIKNKLEGDIGKITLTAEVSSFRAWRSGHWYFDLKDEGVLVPAVMFKHAAARVKFEVEDGQQVLVTAKVSVYAPQSRLQIIVESIEPIGQGALMLAFEQLKNKLKSEGLFEKTHKKQLPKLPKTIGIATSPQGAVLRDMGRILKSRMSGVNILLAPTKVQGPGSAEEISNAVAMLDSSGLCDVIIVGRGGGSLEDLWAFNEEPVARAVYECQTPIVSAVGHEPDVSICDYVADLRCATPTHAAQEVVPKLSEILDDLENKLGYAGQILDSQIKTSYLKLERLAKKLKNPKEILLENFKILQSYVSRFNRINLKNKLTQNKAQIKQNSQKLDFLIKNKVSLEKQNVRNLAGKLQAMSPLGVLSRGYSVVFRNQELISSAKNLKSQDEIKIKLQDGEIGAKIL